MADPQKPLLNDGTIGLPPGPIPPRPRPRQQPQQNLSEFVYFWYLFDRPEYYNACRQQHALPRQGMGIPLMRMAPAERRRRFRNGPFHNDKFAGRILGLGAARRSNTRHWVWCCWDYSRREINYGDHIAAAPTPPQEGQVEMLRNIVEHLKKLHDARSINFEQLKNLKFDDRTSFMWHDDGLKKHIDDMAALLAAMNGQNDGILRITSGIKPVFTSNEKAAELYSLHQQELKKSLTALFMLSTGFNELKEAYGKMDKSYLKNIEVKQLNKSIDAIDILLKRESEYFNKIIEMLGALLRGGQS